MLSITTVGTVNHTPAPSISNAMTPLSEGQIVPMMGGLHDRIAGRDLAEVYAMLWFLVSLLQPLSKD